ncbi:hypothetical protein DSCO28_10310 [Desulfosarcina ovata subsp. sediminis]|uniref:Uncharacterized protein n=1 Tax=Desulfosarcina ovata subsp. sediminis TaxID=885957 RepID=A0A5K7ZJR2_9BACT|nr:hypothetical protein [Desulfosarcina ovata]BBO80465.1 hypothetical protein DSCO28_10310 [Desulfosarcina ovata subsp. sediminis]
MKLMTGLAIGLICLCVVLPAAQAQDARERVQPAFDHYRGKASYTTVEMVIHRRRGNAG